MNKINTSRASAIHSKQTEQLYNGLRYSTISTIISALIVVFIVGSQSNRLYEWLWFAVLVATSSYRWIVSVIYTKSIAAGNVEHNWRLHFTVCAYLTGVIWASAMWVFFQVDSPQYQVVMIFVLAGIAGGALATLSYDKNIVIIYLFILLLGIESRLLWHGGMFTYELAVLVLLYMAFLMKGGREIANSNYELLALRFDTEEHNLTLLSATERVARIGYWQWDMQSKQIELSANLATMCGTEEKYVDIDFWYSRIHEDDLPRIKIAIETVSMTGEESSVEYRMLDAEQTNWTIMNQVIKRVGDESDRQYLLGTVQDISVIKSAEQKIFDMAYFDELTGLANRGHFKQYLIEQIKHALRTETQLAILYLDLDGFKLINDTLGHDKGDLYLKTFSKRLKVLLRDEDFVARLGGDEFCIVLRNVTDAMSSTQVAKRCLTLKNNPIKIDNQDIVPQMSIGIAVYPYDGADVDTLLLAADTAMYAAKRHGKHCFAFYDAQMTRDVTARLELESDLHNALLNNEFHLLYQPKVSLKDCTITGVEALIRWQHPVRGLVPPDDFIANAERIGIIDKIGEWVLDTACRQLQVWKKEGLSLNMAINISSSHFGSSSFVKHVMQVKEAHNIQSGELEIEITESMSRDAHKHIKISHELRETGTKVAIDDFGTGYSSLSVLQLLDVNTLKVDRSFVQNLPDDAPSVLMVKAIVSMALGLGFEVVAEGVETQEQAKFLKEIGCPLVQGYYFSRPVPADAISELVNAGSLLSKISGKACERL